MSQTLELPNGDVVTPDTVFLFNNYPYRFVPLDALEDDEYEFKLVPLYWGNSEMDIPFPDREAFVEQWGPESRGVLSDDEWESWLRTARGDDRFGEEELDALARELPTESATDDGLLRKLRNVLGLVSN